MTLFEQISADIKPAMLAHDSVKLNALRNIKKEFIEVKTAKGSDGELHDDAALKILQKMLKQRKESAEIYLQNGRNELANDELAEAAVIESYLPQPLSDAELTQAILDIIAEVGSKELKAIMPVATKRLAGKAEGRAISEKVKALIAQ